MTSARAALIRIGQLEDWALRMEHRLDRIKTNPESFDTPGMTAILPQAKTYLKKGRELIAEARLDLARDDARLNRYVHFAMIEIESCLHRVERVALPVASTRTPSDSLYDLCVTRFMRQLGFEESITPVTTHKQARNLSVNNAFPDIPVLIFSPSLRSLHILSLIYHEFGHVMWWQVLSDTERTRLIGEVEQYVSREFKDATLEAIDEIAADVFGAAVGGYAFAVNFCLLHLSHKQPFRTTSSRYPSPLERVDLVRRTLDIVGVSAETQEHPVFAAWDKMRQEEQGRDSGEAAPRIDPESIDDFIHSYVDQLGNKRIVLASDRAWSFQLGDDHEPKIDWSKATVPQILYIATKYREQATPEQYRGWSAVALKGLGLKGRRPWGKL